uniref:Alpha-1,3/1,6-mannosyltransferase ALG2 n=1 Tax=Plectus sambesii TaxID=2011161 RepID=A0A914VAN4_9BILA
MLVVYIHPEQWNGGSDRFAAGLLRYFDKNNHRVIWLTTMIDSHWRQEEFGSNVEIWEVGLPLHPGDWFSQNVALGFRLIMSRLDPDLIIVDHSASCLPPLKWRFPRAKILFYCHFPQQLVTPSRFFLYRWYSSIIALVEELLFERADLIMMNSEFTAQSFARVMPSTPKEKMRVVYPPCDVDAIRSGAEPPISRLCRAKNKRYVFLSVNRFWPEKRLDIIVEAAALMKAEGYEPIVKLAGSVMPHIPESRIYYELLQNMATDLDVSDIIEFVPSPTDEQKFVLFRECDSALYTPPNEHFGIVPIEALDQRRPVIVCDSGGPAETVIEGVTGSKIAAPCGRLLADAMIAHMKQSSWPALDNEDSFVDQQRRFVANFSSNGFAQKMNEALDTLFGKGASKNVVSSRARAQA